jgi:hypothetical protein
MTASYSRNGGAETFVMSETGSHAQVPLTRAYSVRLVGRSASNISSVTVDDAPITHVSSCPQQGGGTGGGASWCDGVDGGRPFVIVTLGAKPRSTVRKVTITAHLS